jgi:hypothetical protein
VAVEVIGEVVVKTDDRLARTVDDTKEGDEDASADDIVAVLGWDEELDLLLVVLEDAGAKEEDVNVEELCTWNALDCSLPILELWATARQP